MKFLKNVPKTFREYLEAFNDLGKLQPHELQKGQSLHSADDFFEVSPRVFHTQIKNIIKNDLEREVPKGLETLIVYSVREYQKMKCYLGKNNSSGYALNNGELVSVFSSQQSSGDALMKSAVKNGAKRLVCLAIQKNGKIEGGLYYLYSKHGFKIVSSLNSGKEGKPYSIQKGISYFVNGQGEVEPQNPSVVIFMKR